jgi:hypothetical protein
MPAFRWVVLLLLLGTGTAGAQTQPRSMQAFRDDSELDRYLGAAVAERRRLDAEAEARRPPVQSGDSSQCRLTRHGNIVAAARPDRAVVHGRVLDRDSAPISGVQVLLPGTGLTAVANEGGRYTLLVPGGLLSTAGAVRAQYIGYSPIECRLTIRDGDSLHLDIVLAQQALAFEGITVEAGVVTMAAPASITNTQHDGVDEGGIVKLHGRHLVILRRGRLFTVAVADTLRPVSFIDVFPPGAASDTYDWYDEMVIAGDRIAVIGYSSERDASEINLIRIDARGRLEHEAMYQLRGNDYYSSRNYASRLIGSTLVFYSELPAFGWRRDRPEFPAMRRWTGDTTAPWRRIARATQIYRPGDGRVHPDLSLHTVTSCDMAARELSCDATIVLGPEGRVFYVSPGAVYVWLTEFRRWTRRTEDAREGSLLARLPLDGSPPSAIRVEGSPVDQFSFLESGDRHINVLVRSGADGETMWSSEFARGDAALLRFPIDSFTDGRTAVPVEHYRFLPAPDGYAFHNRFAGDYLLYGLGTGWGRPSDGGARLHLVPWRGGALTRLDLPHGVDRIEVMSRDAVVIGATRNALHFTGISLRGRPDIVQRFVLDSAAQGESRSHGFFYRMDGPDSGVIGLPIRGEDEPGWRQLYARSSAVIFVRNAGRRFRPLGELSARPIKDEDDGCLASCVDWYGNSRPIFLGSRVFALLGYELVEGRISGNAIREVQRVSYAPSPPRTAKPLGAN